MTSRSLNNLSDYDKTKFSEHDQSWPSEFFDLEKSKSLNILDKSFELSTSLENQPSSSKTVKDFKEDISKINNWLLSEFGEIPSYEENPEVIRFFLQMIDNYNSSRKTYGNLEFTYCLLNSEFTAENIKLEKELEATGVLNKIPGTLKDRIDNLASTALFLGAKDTQKVSLQLALTEYQVSSASFREQILLYELENKKLNKFFIQVQNNNLNLDKKLSEYRVNHPQILQKTKQWERDVKLLTEKSFDYEAKIQNLQSEWESKQVDSDMLRLQDLKTLKTEIANKQKHLSKLDHDISGFNQLPPDLHLATLKLEKAKNEEARLKKVKEDLVSKLVPDY